MTDINKRISFMYIKYSADLHMKYKHLFTDSVYDSDQVVQFPLVISWAESDMETADDNNVCLAVATKTVYYPDSFEVSEEFFEDAIQAFILYPYNKLDDENESSKLRLEFVKALLNK